MKKQLVILGIVVILLTVGLSGCNETKQENIQEFQVTGDTDKINITHHEIWHQASWLESEEYETSWEIRGKAKNIAGNMLDNITIEVRFFDSNNYYLDSKITSTKYLPIDEIWTFTLTYNRTDGSYENIVVKIDHVAFDVSVS